MINTGYTKKGRVVALGGSAGGMLMGAVANMQPDLFGGMLSIVPAVDIINSGLDDSLRLTQVTMWSEFGNPNEKEFF